MIAGWDIDVRPDGQVIAFGTGKDVDWVSSIVIAGPPFYDNYAPDYVRMNPNAVVHSFCPPPSVRQPQRTPRPGREDDFLVECCEEAELLFKMTLKSRLVKSCLVKSCLVKSCLVKS